MTQPVTGDKPATARLHDMRNALSPALLLAERLELHDDPQVALTGSRIVAAIEAAVRAGRGEAAG